MGLVLVALAVLAAAVGPLVAPYSPEQFHITARFRGPGPDFWLGTDQFGRDLLSRIRGSANAYATSVTRFVRRNATPPKIVTPMIAGKSRLREASTA